MGRRSHYDENKFYPAHAVPPITPCTLPTILRGIRNDSTKQQSSMAVQNCSPCRSINPYMTDWRIDLTRLDHRLSETSADMLTAYWRRRNCVGLCRQISQLERFCTVLLENTERSYSCPEAVGFARPDGLTCPLGKSDSEHDGVRPVLPPHGY